MDYKEKLILESIYYFLFFCYNNIRKDGDSMIADFIKQTVDYLKDLALSNNMFVAFLIGVSLIILESIIPILPLAVFIAINMIVFGNVLGFIISWISTIIGCTLSFFLFRRIKEKTLKKIEKKPKLKDLMDKIGNVSFSGLVVILAFPFTPAFSINIAAGLSNMSYRKYFFALLISKISIVYFWGFIGTTLIESMTDIGVLIKLAVIILIAFILSKIVMKKFDIK